MRIIRKSEKRDYIWNSVGALSQSATSPILLVFVSRFHGDEGFGVFSYLFSLSIIMWAINLWGGRTYQVSDIKKEFTASGYLAVRLLLAIIVLLIALGFGVQQGFSAEHIKLLVLLTFFKIVEAVADTFFGVLQSHDFLFVAGKSLFLKAVLGITLFFFADFVFHSLLLATLAIVFVNIIFLFFYDYRIAQNLAEYRFSLLLKSFRESISIMKQTWQVAMITIVTSFTINIPRIALAQYHEPALGRFGAIALTVTATALVITFVIQPRILKISILFFSKEYALFHKNIKLILLLFGILGGITLVATILMGIPVLSFIFQLNLINDQHALIIIVLGGILNAIVLLFFNIFIIMRETLRFLWMLLLSNFLLIIVSIWLVSTHSILGAAIAYTVCTFIQSVISFVIYKRKMHSLYNRQKMGVQAPTELET